MLMIPKRRFPLGRLLATPGALEALEDVGQNPREFVVRHLGDDWGNVDAHDRRANYDALVDGGRPLSAYRTMKGRKSWVFTEADRSVTTVLTPEEY